MICLAQEKWKKAVLFDLDDTLFDHKFSRLKGLTALQKELPQLAAVSLEKLEREHEKLLKADYDQVLDGRLSIIEGTTKRIMTLFIAWLKPQFGRSKKERQLVQQRVCEQSSTCSRKQRTLDRTK